MRFSFNLNAVLISVVQLCEDNVRDRVGIQAMSGGRWLVSKGAFM